MRSKKSRAEKSYVKATPNGLSSPSERVDQAEPSRYQVERVPKVTASDFRALAAFRYEIRKFLAFSEVAARAAQIEPQQHQLLLAVQGLPLDTRPTIRAVSERLCVKHHTTVALVDKLEERGLLVRERSQEDRREVLLSITPEGMQKLQALSILHKDQLRAVGGPLLSALGTILGELEPPAQNPKAKAKREKKPRPEVQKRAAGRRSASGRAGRFVPS